MKSIKLADFDGVAFDFEGTLADTIHLHHKTRMQAFSKHGFGHITREQHELGPTYGSSHTDVLGGILYAAGEIDKKVPFDQNEMLLQIIATKSDLFKTVAAKGFDEVPGAVKFVMGIGQFFKHKMVIVTSSEEEFVYPFIKRYNLGAYFPKELVIGHESVMTAGLETKPAADPYLLAMRKLGAKKILVFEDTIPGVASAKKAGATVIAVSFDKANSKLFKKGGLEYPPDAVADSYKIAAQILGL